MSAFPSAHVDASNADQHGVDGDARADVVDLQRRRRADAIAAVLGSSDEMRAVRRALECSAKSNAPVLIVGESGTGRSLVARCVHDVSARRAEPFEHVSCGAMAREAFARSTGVEPSAMPSDGTIFLDEVDALTSEMQARMVRFFDDRSASRSRAPEPRSLRFVASTSIDLDAVSRRGSFRTDLLHRLNTIIIQLPSLAARGRADFVELLQAFAGEQSRRLTFAKEAIDLLLTRDWRANVRELRSIVERLAVMSEKPHIDRATAAEFAPGEAQAAAGALASVADTVLAAPAPPNGRMRALEIAVIDRALEISKDETAAARLLGTQRRVMLRRRARLARGGTADCEDSE